MTTTTYNLGGFPVTVVNHDEGLCPVHKVELRLRRSAEQGACCCCRDHPEDEPECDGCGAALMVDDPPGPLCRDCTEERGNG